MLYRTKQSELGVRVEKPLPVEPTAREAEENQCQSEHCAQYPHAAFEAGDLIAQDVLACVVRVQRDDFPEAPLDPRPRRGGRDPQLGEEIGVPTSDDLLLDTMIIDAALAIGHSDRRRRSAGHEERAVQR